MKCYRCSRTGVYFPPDYVEEWGRKYGIGMGRTPVSEALINNYRVKPVRSKRQPAYHVPVAVCKAQVDYVDIPDDEYYANMAVLHAEDRDYRLRGQIMRDKSLVKKGSTMQQYCPDEIDGAVKRIETRRTEALAKYLPSKEATKKKEGDK